MTKTEAAEAIALQVVVQLRRQVQLNLELGQDRLYGVNGKTACEEVLSEALGGHMGDYLRRAAETTCLRSVRIAAKRMVARS